MENNIGLFGQIRYVLKGIFKPRFFNRLSKQGRGKVVAHVLFVSVIATLLYWGIQVLIMNMPNGIIGQADSLLKTVPQINYSNHTLTAEGDYQWSNIMSTRYVLIDTSVDKADQAYVDKICIRTDWSNGKVILAFNGKNATFVMPFGNYVCVDYSKIETVLFLPSTLNNTVLGKQYVLAVYKITGMLAVATYPFFAVTAVISGLMVALIGFGIQKILKLMYSIEELIKVGIFIACFTGFIKVILNAQPLPINIIWINIIFLLASGAYMFFALTGSQEEVGPSSTISFTKPTSSRFSGNIEPEDPFARKDRFRTKRATEQAPAPVVKEEPVVVAAPVYTQPVETAPVYTAPVVEETVTYEQPVQEYVQEPAYETGTVAYEEPVATYTEPAYSEPTYTEQTYTTETTYTEPAYTETAATYTEPVVEKPVEDRPTIIKSDISFGVGYGTSSPNKKSKPKYDRPITAPDSYNGAYYGGGDEEGYSNTYGSSTLLDRGGLYGKTLGAPSGSTESNPFGDVINASAERNTVGSLRYTGSTASSSYHSDTNTTGGVSFTTKSGNQPFSASTYTPTFSQGKTVNSSNTNTSSKPYTKKGSSKPISRYSADDFAAWEREAYADEFNKPRGGFGNNI